MHDMHVGSPCLYSKRKHGRYWVRVQLVEHNVFLILQNLY